MRHATRAVLCGGRTNVDIVPRPFVPGDKIALIMDAAVVGNRVS